MRNQDRTSSGLHRLLLGICVLIHLALTVLLFNSFWKAVRPFDDIPFDGPFQTYNALRRIDAGQRPGREFFVFHGVGVPLVQYPYFKILGSDIVASETTRLFLRRLQVIAVVLLFSWFFRLGWIPSLLVWPVAIGTGLQLYFYKTGTNSLPEFRSLFPIIVAGFILAPREIPLRVVWVGVATALALLCGVEHGVAVTVAASISVAAAATASLHKPIAWGLLKDIVLGLGLGIFLMLSVWFALGGPAAVAASLRFYFVDLANDQFWYFGVPPNPVFYGKWLTHERFYAVALISPIGFFLSWLAFRKADSQSSCRLSLGLMTLFAYSGLALFSYLGISSNVLPSLRAIVAAGVCIAITAWNSRFGVVASPTRKSYWWRTIIFALIAVSPLILTPIFRAQGGVGYSQGYEEDVATFFQITGASPQNPGAVTVWSDYAGVIEERLNVFHPHTDYLIHALGPARRASYLEKFHEMQPDFVVAADPEFRYAPWLWQSFWAFYRNLVVDYEVVGRTRYMLIWKRKTNAATVQAETPWVDATTLDDGQTYQIACPREPGKVPFMEIKVTYACDNPLAKVPLLGKLPRLFIYPSHTLETLPVSLPPYQQEFTFPVVPSGEGDIQLRYGVESIVSGASLKIESVQARVVAQLDPDHPLLQSSAPAGKP